MNLPDLDQMLSRITPHRREALERIVSQRTRYFTLVLEDFKDPHNISAVMRSCEVFGIQDVHVVEERNAYQVGKSVLKGSYKWLHIQRYKRRQMCLETLRKKGYRIAVASTNTDRELDELEFNEPTAIYLGSESLGNSPETLSAADLTFKIRQYGLTESLNVSVCAGVILATLTAFMRKAGREKFTLNSEEKSLLLRELCARHIEGLDKFPSVRTID